MAEAIVSLGDREEEFPYDTVTGAAMRVTGEGNPGDVPQLVGSDIRFFPTGGGGTIGDVSRAGATNDNRIVRWDGSGASIQNSVVTIDDSGNITGYGTLAGGSSNIQLTNAVGNARLQAFDPAGAALDDVIYFNGTSWGPGTLATISVDLTTDVTGVLPDANVANDLTIENGNINATPIGIGVSADGAFTTVSINSPSEASQSLNIAGAIGAQGVTVFGTQFRGYGSRGTYAAPTTSLVNDTITAVWAYGRTSGGTWDDAAAIALGVAAAPTATVVEGKITFFTNNAAGILTTALTIDSSQLATFSSGIAVNGTATALADITSSGVDSDARVKFTNDAQTWMWRLRGSGGAGDRFEIYDSTGAVAPFLVYPGVLNDVIRLTSAGIVINESSNAAVDLRWESDSNPNGLMCDAGVGGVGIGMIPVRTLDVTGTFGATGAVVLGSTATIATSLNVAGNTSALSGATLLATGFVSLQNVGLFGAAYVGYGSNGTLGSPTVSASNDVLTGLLGYGYPASGSTRVLAASMSFVVDGSPSGTTVMPTRIAWATCNAAGTFAERMRLTAEGLLGIGMTPTRTLDVTGTFGATGNCVLGNVGTNAHTVNGGLTVTSTTLAFIPPRVTTTQKNAMTGTAGSVVYDSTLGKLCVRGAAAWETITSV